MTEQRHGPRHMIGISREIYLIPRKHLVIAGGYEHLAIAIDRDHDHVEIGEQFGQLLQRRVDDGTALIEPHADHLHLSLGEGNRIEGAGNLKTSFDGPGHLDFR